MFQWLLFSSEICEQQCSFRQSCHASPQAHFPLICKLTRRPASSIPFIPTTMPRSKPPPTSTWSSISAHPVLILSPWLANLHLALSSFWRSTEPRIGNAGWVWLGSVSDIVNDVAGHVSPMLDVSGGETWIHTEHTKWRRGVYVLSHWSGARWYVYILVVGWHRMNCICKQLRCRSQGGGCIIKQEIFSIRLEHTYQSQSHNRSPIDT